MRTHHHHEHHEPDRQTPDDRRFYRPEGFPGEGGPFRGRGGGRGRGRGPFRPEDHPDMPIPPEAPGFPGGGPRDRRRGGWGGRGGGPHRAPRGDVRTAVLLLLAEEPMHGYQLMQTIGERTGGRWNPSPGAIYPTISQLEDEGLVLTEKEAGRKRASLTEAGRSHVEENQASWPNPFPGADDEDAGEQVDLRSLVHDLGGAVREVGRAGNDAQRAEAASILTEAKAKMYKILAGDTEG